MVKTCVKCGLSKPLKEFHARGRGGRQCMACLTEQTAQRQAPYPESAAGLAIRRFLAHTHRRNGSKTLDDGSVTGASLRKLLEAYMYLCGYCYAPWSHFDHIVPLARGGPHCIANLIPACAKCNMSKSARLYGTEWTERKSCAS